MGRPVGRSLYDARGAATSHLRRPLPAASSGDPPAQEFEYEEGKSTLTITNLDGPGTAQGAIGTGREPLARNG
jgi:hypothetical protein